MEATTALRLKGGESLDEVVELWNKAYDLIEELAPEKKEVVDRLRERLQRVHGIRKGQIAAKGRSYFGVDDSFYDWLDEMNEKERASMDGDFPLGNEEDARFAGYYFTIEEIAKIQCGVDHWILTGQFTGHNYDVYARKGLIAELYGEWDQAVKNYEKVPNSQIVLNRAQYCRQKMAEEGARCYEKAQAYMQSGEWSEVPDLLSRGVEMGNADAMVDFALARVYGQYGLAQDMVEALNLLRRAAKENNARACFTLCELHDEGYYAVEGAEAKEACEKAASLGHVQAKARLKDGFDVRPLEVILEEHIQKGDVDSAWVLALILQERGDKVGSDKWFTYAVEHGQVDALLHEADCCKKEDPAQAKRYYRRAADEGNLPAILALSEMELNEGDPHFWERATALAEQEVDAALLGRHQKEFAWYKLAAEAGDTDAMARLCVGYHYGYPVDKDDKEGYAWAKRGSDEGNLSASYYAAYFLEHGYGVQEDVDEAVRLYTLSAEGGVTSSMLRLYAVYKDGLKHIQPNKEKSLRYLWLSGVGRP